MQDHTQYQERARQVFDMDVHGLPEQISKFDAAMFESAVRSPAEPRSRKRGDDGKSGTGYERGLEVCD